MNKIASVPGLIVQSALTALAFPPSGLAAVVPDWYGNSGDAAQIDVVVTGSTAISLSSATMYAAKLASMIYADKTFTVVASTDVVTANAHGLGTGDGPFPIVNAGGALPAGLPANGLVWFIKIDANTGKFAASLSDALKGVAIDVTSTGSGTNSITDNADTKRVNWLSLGAFPDYSLAVGKGAMKRYDCPTAVVAYGLVATLDTGAATVEVTPIVSVA